MSEHMPIDNLDHFVASQYHPTAASGQVQVLAVNDVARQLASYREDYGLSQAQVSKEAGWSVSKVIRIEGGQVLPSTTDVLALLAMYDVTDDAKKMALRERALTNRKQRRPNPYSSFMEPMDARYLEYEPAATDGIWLYGSIVMPDFLQTSDYTARADQVLRPNENPAVTASFAQLRRERASYLLGKYGPPLRLILSEEVLWRPEGGEHLSEDQRYTQLSTILRGIKKLHTAGRQPLDDTELNPDITIQVVPFRSASHAAPFGQSSCNILNIPEHPSAAYLHRTHYGTFTHDDPAVADKYRRLFDTLATHIPGPDETNDFLDAILNKLANDSLRGNV